MKIENGHYNSYLMKTLWQNWQDHLTGKARFFDSLFSQQISVDFSDFTLFSKYKT